MPRLGLGSIDLSATTGGGNSVTGIDDFVFESFTAGQMHPKLTTSRTNLITYSEDISNNSWNKINVQATSSIASPVSSASFLIEETSYSSSSSRLQLTSGISVSAGTYTASFYVKNNSGRYLGIVLGTSSQRIRTNFDFDTETFKTAIFTGQTTGTVSFEKDGDFYRISVKATFPSTVAAVFSLHPLATDTYPFFTNYDSDNRSFHVSGFQLEQDSFASAYIPTSGSAVTVATILNDTSNVWDFDGTDIMIEEDPESEGFWEESYPDGATLPELVLNGDYEDLGSNLVSSGTFSSFSVESGDVTISGDTASYVDGGGNSNSRVTLASVLTASKMYKVVFSVTRYVAGRVQMIFGGGNTFDVDISAGVGTYTTHVLAGSSTSVSIKRNGGFPGFDFDLTSISIQQVDPNDRWTLGTGWTIEDGKANFDASAASTFSFLTQASILPSPLPLDYELTFTLSDLGGSFSYSNAGIVRNGTVTSFSTLGLSTPGTHTIIVTETSSSNFLFFGHPNSDDFSIDNVSIKEYAIQPLDI